MFSQAEPYEQFMGRWSRRLAPLLVTYAGVRDGDAVADIGSGTGALTAAVAAAAPSSPIVGVDRSEAYVAHAREHHQRSGIRFEVGDADMLPLPDASCDRTLSLLMLNFMPDPGTAAIEMLRVTRPGGTMAAAVWDYGEGMGMLRTFWDEVVALDPGADGKDERHMPLTRQGELAALWRKHGLLKVSSEPLTIETRFSSFDDYWTPFLQKQGPSGAHVASLSADDRERLRLNLRRRLLGDAPDGPIVLSARAWAVRGIVANDD